MKFKERSFYITEGQRPRPNIHFNEKENLIIVTTTWGKKVNQEKIVSVVENYLLSSIVDDEVTSPFILKPHLGKNANRLRAAILLLNEYIFNEYNKNEYVSGLEIFVGFKNQNEFVFSNIGQPHTLFSRSNKNIIPLQQHIDLSMDFCSNSMKPSTYPPLPSRYLGIDPHIDFDVLSIRPQVDDKFILLSYFWIPDFLVSLPNNDRSFDEIFKRMSQCADQSSWIGILDF